MLLKLLELTQFARPNLSIYFNFLCAVPRDDVIESTRFLVRPPVNHFTMVYSFHHGLSCMRNALKFWSFIQKWSIRPWWCSICWNTKLKDRTKNAVTIFLSHEMKHKFHILHDAEFSLKIIWINELQITNNLKFTLKLSVALFQTRINVYAFQNLVVYRMGGHRDFLTVEAGNIIQWRKHGREARLVKQMMSYSILQASTNFQFNFQ